MARQLDLRIEPFMNGASVDMDVDGSVEGEMETIYRVAPPAGESWVGICLRLLIVHGIGWTPSGFAGGAVLPVGLLLRKKENTDTIYSWNMRTNTDLYGRFNRKTMDELSGTHTVAVFELEAPSDVGFQLGEDDALEFVIQDNLIAIDSLQAVFIHGVLA